MFILEKTFLYPKQEYQANRFACQLMLGEKAALYETEIKEVVSENLEDMAQVIWKLTRGEGEGY